MRKPLPRLYLLYHELRPGGSEYSYVTGTDQFERHLELYLKERAEKAVLWPEVTFDDGHVSNFEYAAPALAARGMTARFFITVGWTGRKAGYMGWEELRSLHEAGHVIGAHGWSHTLLTHCDEDGLKLELGGARRELEDKLGTAITTMSLPGGRYNRRVLGACEEAGYREIYTSAPQAEAVPHGRLVGRLNIRGDMTLDWISRLFEPDGKLLGGLGRQHRMKSYAKAVLGDVLYAKLWARLNRQEAGADEGQMQ
ncbi:polysaccharide deacetylase family protein [Edaphobacter acidisoli]|uniref:polysaccharide deacetylase family protein n=1 Tax=Edaphobacter acidisoli TaxID=2040573 RepID=UPI00166D8139|nr:polysaccharide deacetylase family protein [Edaphobacter acidisoli]